MSTVSSDQADELERYRRAAEDTLQQLDWCIGYLHAINKGREAAVLARNHRTIRALMKRQDQPAPAGDFSQAPKRA